MAHGAPLGFDGLVPAEEDQGASKDGEYTVEFSMTGTAADVEPQSTQRGASEEIGLLEPKNEGDKEQILSKKKAQEETVFFEDGLRRIDFILTYQDDLQGKKAKDDSDEKKDKRKKKRETFLENLEKRGIQLELQDCSESPDRKTYYVKLHGTHDTLLRGAEEMLLRMPIQENNLRQLGFRDRLLDCFKINDPLQPKIPRHLKRTSYFTAPFSYDKRENFIGYDDETGFFTTAQRSAIVYNIMLNVRYGHDDDQVGLLRLLSNKSVTAAFPLHESSEKLLEGQTEKDMTDRQLLYSQWSHPKNWYKRQPLDQIRRYFGEKVGIYFTWLGFYTTWLLPASIVGLIVTIVGFFTITEAIPDEVCDEGNRYDFYMCPPCAVRCDFWYLIESCGFSRIGRIFDNGATVFFAIFMSFWAAFFLEFWKRRQFFLQYDWDVLGFEESEQRPRPQFEQKIKQHMRRCKTDKGKQKFLIHNPVLDKQEYVQPSYWFYPKLVGTLSILFSMIIVVLAVVFAVIVYRLAVGTVIYSIVSGSSLGPAVGSIVVSITGAAIQLVAIIIMNKVYEFLAFKLTNWELHRTQTDYDDNFITKMYLFQFFNFYTSLFYIAFIKGNATGNPGNYSLIGNSNNLRIDECPAYGCLLELTIQLFIIMVGKQALNNVQELAIPYVKRIINCLKHKEETDEDVFARWEKDNDLVPINQHGLFFEYLELIIQYGFTTLFVASFPLAPFFALLNNYFEIRIDAHKFVVVQRRTISERAGDIGAWYNILTLITYMAIMMNAFLIAFTAQIIPISVYQYGGEQPDDLNGLSGYVNWSLSPFTVEKLIPGGGYPAFNGQRLQLYNSSRVVQDGGEDLLYLPYVDFACVQRESGNPSLRIQTIYNVSGVPDELLETGGAYLTMNEADYRNQVANNASVRNLILISGGAGDTITNSSTCFRPFVQCRYRGFARDGGFEGQGDDRQSVTVFGRTFWQVLCARMAFVVIFEHFVIIVVAVIAFLIPDVPQSVQNEIRREKLLAYEAIRARNTKPKSPSPPVEDPVATTSI